MAAPEREHFWTIPNILSLYRLLAFPFICYVLWLGNRPLFVGLLAFNLFTDILDGYIARRFNMQTSIGARLDSWADVGSYLLAYAGIFQFERPFLLEHKYGLSLFAFLFLASFLTATVKFGGIVGLHLYSIKITGYLQGAFLLWLLWRGNLEWFYILMIGFGCLAKLEEICVLLYLRTPRSNARGLYWVLQNR